MKPISQMTREEKLQEIVEYNPCRVERSAVLRYLLAVRRNDTEQIAYFESFGKSVRHIILNVRTYERGMIFGYVGKQFNEHGWINGMLPIIEEIKLDTFNTIIRKLSDKESFCWSDNTTKRNVGLFPTEAITTQRLSAV